ncbi:MgtC/SapB family protein [Pseudogracilibacillus auburnensis]|uniref:Putative Mg2+ transporter-C (MgtC) family protein n=1 Tax=Pseudogracilibacillus auburnensis TaxID=1494959 RepID=A0A2V3VVJ0_9BACI|nr:MgtC/SapB family protein [Pseudogracilibacillus auburnensis]MBO1001763.1 MgtC/SapB family protein [Pseudogracilibacillus auburnensis]PXW85993.1 putative Mg2+ transporter-C (MgtC) family protein [Pseudogracilibacillus auburnensis]
MTSILIKLCYASIAGLVLGIEREAKHKPLGLKTCVVISVTSCLLTIISIEAAISSYNDMMFIRADPMRLAAQIVSGVGFLGAGVILRRNNDVISGLTTAAIVWTASGIGIGIGAGYYKEASLGVIIIIISVRFLPYIVHKVGPSTLNQQNVSVNLFVDYTVDIEKMMVGIREILGDIKHIKISGEVEGHKIELACKMKEDNETILKYYHKVNSISGVVYAEIEAR